MTSSRPAQAVPGISEPTIESITQLLDGARSGDSSVWNSIYRLLYSELHSIARTQVRHSAHRTISPTALINETWIKLSQASIRAENKAQFVGLMATAMRSIMVDETKRKLTLKRGGDVQHCTVSDDIEIVGESRLESLIALNAALTELEQYMPRLAKVVELRYFGGLQEAEIARLLDVTVRTVRRDWSAARMFLLKQLGDEAS